MIARVIRRLRSAGLVVGALAVAPSPVGAQSPEAARLESVRAQVSAEVGRALVELTAQAERRGLPTEPLLNKALEGTAKRVPSPQILTALRQVLDDLGSAQALLEGSAFSGPQDVAAVAVALRRGAPPEAVRRLSLGAPVGEPIGATVHALADLMQRGVDDRDALRLLLTWRTQGGDAGQLRQLPAAVDLMLRQGSLPTQAAAAIEAALRAGRLPAGLGPPAGAGPPTGRP